MNRSKPWRQACAAAALCLALGTGAAQAAMMPPGIAWVEAKATRDIDAAFAKARAEKTPVLLYWGAAWCPPCNQLKATLFNRQDFIALSRTVMPVHLDGDLPGAQALGSKFKVVGYPTLILFGADGQELTRLPGEADPIRIVEAMQRTLAGARSTRAILDDARAGKPLPHAEWQALAFYSWGTDEAQLAGGESAAQVLAALAEAAAKDAGAGDELATRFWLKALAERGGEKDAKPAADAAAVQTRLQGLLADPARTRRHADVLIGGAKDIVRIASSVGSAERAALIDAYDTALKRLQNDAELSRADRTDCLISRVALRRLELPDTALDVALPGGLREEVQAHAARMDKEIDNGYERQAVMTSAGYLLRVAGLPAESDALLTANLKKSHSPYYLMSQLATNAKLQGKSQEALAWHERAYKESKGPATRLQWGATYVTALFELAPGESRRIDKAVADVLADAAKDKGAFYDRSSRSLKRIATRAAAWEDKAAAAKLRTRFDALCAKLPAKDPQRATCGGLWPAG